MRRTDLNNNSDVNGETEKAVTDKKETVFNNLIETVSC